VIFVDVDIQHDFCAPEGALHVPGAPNETWCSLTRMACERGIPILGSVDSHAFDAWEFASNDNVGPNGEDPQFPEHCVKGTAGWLKVRGTLAERYRFVPCVHEQDARALASELAAGTTQALYFEKEVYSFFANPIAEPLIAALMKPLEEPRFIVYGVATDYCVKAAALGLRERGYDVSVLTDAVVGITKEGVDRALAEMGEAGVRLCESRTLF
jgi:nicotinamidase/pyrazinamidase